MNLGVMKPSCRSVVVFFVLICGAALLAQDVATPVPTLTPAQMEEFLLHARVRSIRAIGRGVTNAQRATLSDGRLTHDVQVQTIDQALLVFEGTNGPELNFKDMYRYNIAAYRLARLLGLDNVPMSVERTTGGKPGAITWWIDDVMMEEGERSKKNVSGPDPERTAMQIHIMRVFDELIQNSDRNAGNALWTKDWMLWMVDHTRAFRLGKTLRRPNLLERCERDLLAGLRMLSADSIKAAVGNSLMREEIDAVLVRRNVIIALFENRIATQGEPAVLYTMSR